MNEPAVDDSKWQEWKEWKKQFPSTTDVPLISMDASVDLLEVEIQVKLLTRREA